MNAHRRFFVLALVPFMILYSAAQAAPEASDPVAVVQGLYKTDLKHFGFDKEVVKADRPYLAPDLYAALLKQAIHNGNPGDAGNIDSDVIFNAQDLPAKYTVGQATIDKDTAKVPVDLAWEADKLHFTVYLKQFAGAWKVTEIDYGKDGKLTDSLK